MVVGWARSSFLTNPRRSLAVDLRALGNGSLKTCATRSIGGRSAIGVAIGIGIEREDPKMAFGHEKLDVFRAAIALYRLGLPVLREAEGTPQHEGSTPARIAGDGAEDC